MITGTAECNLRLQILFTQIFAHLMSNGAAYRVSLIKTVMERWVQGQTNMRALQRSFFLPDNQIIHISKVQQYKGISFLLQSTKKNSSFVPGFILDSTLDSYNKELEDLSATKAILHRNASNNCISERHKLFQ